MRDINALINKNKGLTKSASVSSNKATSTSKKLNQTVNQSKSKRVGLADIKSVAEQRFGQRKPKKQQPKQNKSKKKSKPIKPQQAFEAQSKHEKLSAWKKAMDKTHVPVAKVEALYRRIEKLSGSALQMVEKELFVAEQFDMIYNWKSSDETLIDEYIEDLDEAISKAEANSDTVLDITDVMGVLDDALSGDSTALVAASVIAPVVLGYASNDYVASYIDQDALTDDIRQTMESKFANVLAKNINMTNSEGVVTITEFIGSKAIQTKVSTADVKQKYGIDLNTSEGQSAFDDIITNQLQDVYKTHVQDPATKILEENMQKQRAAERKVLEEQLKEFIDNQNKNK